MEQVLTGLPNYSMEKIVSFRPLVFEMKYLGRPVCPKCDSGLNRIKASFWRRIRSVPMRGHPVTLRIKCSKHHCKDCGRYFNTRLEGVKKWSRTTEPLKKEVFRSYNNGLTNKAISRESGIGVASAERYYHQVIRQKASHRKNRPCPRYLGIDEHRFTRKVGFTTTFCDLANRNVFDISPGRSSSELQSFLRTLKGRKQVKMVCIDMNSAYRHMVRNWFPNAKIVTDRFHVIKLVNHHFTRACKLIDEEKLSYGRGGILRAMLCRPDHLSQKRQVILDKYFQAQPAIHSIYLFCQELNELLRTKGMNQQACAKPVQELLEKIGQLQQSPMEPLRTLGKTLNSWKEEVARMFRYSKSNGTTEGFHRKMKLIQRRAYGFRNFENYRQRVKVLCG